jgi:hypothetical protein
VKEDRSEGSALVLLFLFFGVVGFGLFALTFLILGFRDSRDAVLCHVLSLGSLGLAAACVVVFSLVSAPTQRRVVPSRSSRASRLKP